VLDKPDDVIELSLEVLRAGGIEINGIEVSPLGIREFRPTTTPMVSLSSPIFLVFVKPALIRSR